MRCPLKTKKTHRKVRIVDSSIHIFILAGEQTHQIMQKARGKRQVSAQIARACTYAVMVIYTAVCRSQDAQQRHQSKFRCQTRDAFIETIPCSISVQFRSQAHYYWLVACSEPCLHSLTVHTIQCTNEHHKAASFSGPSPKQNNISLCSLSSCSQASWTSSTHSINHMQTQVSSPHCHLDSLHHTQAGLPAHVGPSTHTNSTNSTCMGRQGSGDGDRSSSV